MRLFTIQVSRRGLARKFNVEFVDTTVKTGKKLFAPTWDMVLGHKEFVKTGEGYSDEDYSRDYRRRLIRSWMENREDWMKFVEDDTPMALGCYCRSGDFCHRHLLVKFLEELCGNLKIPFEFYGELTYESTTENSNDQSAAS